ncbi:dienelactone hydrolase family protein [Ancylothrix sp. C2]|uniref:dienelactone hydrolase family protein n=1 Tax=Ancylothrix sp. D3o TaxID=2953691 RepID=UPI0021BA455B|nr:dienelactone hydrolase family protein [Ancylothrix sp. D3o]MCT7950493.1 dienelactone hydrolase family protein [Ancylothrix sp. D3o]
MNSQQITIKSADSGNFSAYLATPTTSKKAGLILIQEIFGINATMRQLADSYAEAGYLTIVPDLFWRIEPNIELSDQNENHWQKAFELYNKFDENKGIEDLIATLNTLKQQLENNTGKIASVGYCLGGKLAYLMATRSQADCNVSYYGVAIENNLNESQNIKKPLLLHLAGNDEYVSSQAQTQISSHLKNNPLITLHSYPNLSHGFARVGGTTYNPEAAEQANQRTQAFLQKHLN